MDLDEVDLAILEIYDMADDAGVSPSQIRAMLRERVEIAYAIIEADDWPDLVSTAVH